MAGLQLTGMGVEIAVEKLNVAGLNSYMGESFDFIVLATKAHDALDVAPKLLSRLTPGGVLLPLQNGSIPLMLAERLGADNLLGGISNFGATMVRPGLYEQRNNGHLLIGELAGGASERAERIRQWLGQAINVRIAQNFSGAVWAKLLLNCSVTTIGAIAGQTMRQYIATPDGRELFRRTYDEALRVALASNARPETMIVEPIPPSWSGQSAPSPAYAAWLDRILNGYGDLKPSMLQDFENGRKTEIKFINGYIVSLGQELSIPTPANAAIVETVLTIERRQITPDPSLLGRTLHASK
tara:strand:+ start:4302 stop:5195 length:894 start_codon:yes stop_codon:yes gene_type:complete